MNLEYEKSFWENTPENTYNLTIREAEYLVLVAMGFKNSEIARIFIVSKSTVKKTLENIFLKLYAKDRANAVALAFLYGILNDSVIIETLEKYRLEKLIVQKYERY